MASEGQKTEKCTLQPGGGAVGEAKGAPHDAERRGGLVAGATPAGRAKTARAGAPRGLGRAPAGLAHLTAAFAQTRPAGGTGAEALSRAEHERSTSGARVDMGAPMAC